MLQSEITTPLELNLNLSLNLNLNLNLILTLLKLLRLSYAVYFFQNRKFFLLMVFQNLSSICMIYLEGIVYVAIRYYNAIRAQSQC